MLRDGWLGGRHTRTFTLQWHLTHACEGRCAHCYDRSDVRALPTDACLAILADYQAFCRRHAVRGQVSLSGGNPLLHPGFWEIYAAVAAAGLPVSILGNPCDDATLDRLLAVRRPGYYQVSLEGLEATNDAIRGAGHFRATLDFLRRAKARGLNTHVMLTLHRANQDEVLPLAETLAGLTGKFTFNRLAQVGEGAALAGVEPAGYAAWLRAYLDAAATRPVLGVKENLFNVLRRRDGKAPFGGCTGHGCGAAFNFVAVLPDGAVHACRKFPSPLGNLTEQSLVDIYASPAARRYRQGPRACHRCPLRAACRGCMAVVYGLGGDPLATRDPYCFR
jgi:selenobiotic family peptide radical SAM maturase